MDDTITETKPVLIIGDGKLACSVTVCLVRAGYFVNLFTNDKQAAFKNLTMHFDDVFENTGEEINQDFLQLTEDLDGGRQYQLIIIVTDENVSKKRLLIEELERTVPANSIIAVNTESIALSALQKGFNNPERIIGLNWSEPAHNTYFLEIIANDNSSTALADTLHRQAKKFWGKDPYIIHNDYGIRARLLAAMTREAFYLLENGFASVEDIDRACRNDPGYYLPFAGNFRYIDMMGGPIGYGRVMKGLNPELSKSRQIPDFFIDIVKKSGQSMEDNGCMYEYKDGDAEKWEKTFRKYSYQIKAIIEKYPFKYAKGEASE